METHDSLQIAPGALGENHHICAFFNGMDEHYQVLRSFIRDGFDKGDRAFHLVDPEQRAEHLRRLADVGIDVDEAMASGQLEVHPWQDGPLHGDRFDQDAWLEGFEQVLQSGPAAGYAKTRLLSPMPTGWIGKEPPAVATGLADALVELLQLDFAFVRLTGPGGAEAVEVTRGSAWSSFPDWLARRLAASANLGHKEVVPEADGSSEPCRGLVIPVGFNGDRGLVAAACWRSDFPTPTDELLLSLAANHAATAFQTACAEEALRHARNELETKVAERTAELGQLAEEQAALRRVATLVARGAPAQDLF